MFAARFDNPTRITSQLELQIAFETDRVYLTPGGSVEFVGETTLSPGAMFSGECRFRDTTRIDNGCILNNVRLGCGNVIRAYSMLSDLTAGDRNLFGPFCFVRDGCVVGDDCILGAHVETARSSFGAGTKISHRAFVGDAKIGEHAIIGAGVVFCNFDGQGRQTTQVGSHVTIGSGALVVPPLTIGADAIIAAGSTVTKDVAPGTKLIQKRQ
jgi:bifunctional UDP-N-acetylglucosamine pyrophosphorylase/glucosamine-1-phosphate N-acetyltransferase